MTKSAFAPGKIILCGEYAVVFGYPGLAAPSTQGIRASFIEDSHCDHVTFDWPEAVGNPWEQYLNTVIRLCVERGCQMNGTLRIAHDLPLGKGMGSSTALVVAVCRCLLGEDREAAAHAIEDAVNPGNSGIDFAVIWGNRALRFERGTTPQAVNLPDGVLANASLIDTGTPTETTPQLVAWVKERSKEPSVRDALRVIGNCTERILSGENPNAVIREHHRSQIILGVVPNAAKEVIAEIEHNGGAGKVLGAGSRNGGGGMVLAFQNR